MVKVLLGQYLERDSFYHRVHPLIKIVLFFVTSVLTLITEDLAAYIIFSMALLFSVVAGKLGLKNFLQAIKPVIFIFIWTFIFQVLFNKNGELVLQVGFLQVYDQTLLNSVLVFFRMFILVGVSAVLTLSTSPIEITHGFEDFFKPLKYIKVPVEAIALTLSIALRFIPLFFEEVKRIDVAQKSKGFDIEDLNFAAKFRYYAFLLIPLMLSAVSKAEDIANAMEIKGYGIGEKRSRFRVYGFTIEDLILALLYLIILLGIFFWIIPNNTFSLISQLLSG